MRPGKDRRSAVREAPSTDVDHARTGSESTSGAGPAAGLDAAAGSAGSGSNLGVSREIDLLTRDLIEAFGSGKPWSEGLFGRLAMRVFAWQFENNPVYRRFAEGRGATPATVLSWEDVPAVPASAFKQLSLISGDSARVERVFRTSGTSAVRRGEHLVQSLALYRASLLPPFREHVVPEGEMTFLSLVPSPEVQPDSSLSTMVGAAMAAFGTPESAWLAGADGVDFTALDRALASAERKRRPVLIVGTAFAFVHWMDASAHCKPTRFRLPNGSRVLETGGFKGRSRVVSREELYAALSSRLGIGPEWIVNEYGMTELLSQYYEPGVGRAPLAGSSLAESLAARRLVPPPWLRSRVVDPVTLEPVRDGERGLIAHFDLANVGSVAAVLTEDMGFRDAAGLKLIGRTPGAEPRGCSIAMDELLSAAETD